MRPAEQAGYEEALLVRIDPSDGQTSVVVSHKSPPEVYDPHEPGIAFHACTLSDGQIYLCTGTEVMAYGAADFVRRSYLTLPEFNDVHHVSPSPSGTLFVVNTGLDSVIETDWHGTVHNRWHVLQEQTRPPTVDFRLVSTKPHRAHPNYVFWVGNQPWVTRFRQRDAIDLMDPRRVITLGGTAGPHDGLVQGGLIYFTTVDGQIVVVDAETLEVRRRIDVRGPGGATVGWCRGIHVEGNFAWVGFTRLRQTRFRENLSWIRTRGALPRYPTHIACYDLTTGQRLMEHRLSGVGMDVIFGILPASA